MQDPFYGHRDFSTGEPLRPKDEWSEWDYALVAAYQLIQDLTNKHGLLEHEVESDRVIVTARKTQDRFQAAVDRMTSGTKTKGYTPMPGETFTPHLELRYGEWPTFREYFEKLSEDGSD